MTASRRDLAPVVLAIGEGRTATIAALCDRLGLTWHACYERLKDLVRMGVVLAVRRGRGGCPGLYALAVPLDAALEASTEPAIDVDPSQAARALEAAWPAPISRAAQ